MTRVDTARSYPTPPFLKTIPPRASDHCVDFGKGHKSSKPRQSIVSVRLLSSRRHRLLQFGLASFHDCNDSIIDVGNDPHNRPTPFSLTGDDTFVSSVQHLVLLDPALLIHLLHVDVQRSLVPSVQLPSLGTIPDRTIRSSSGQMIGPSMMPHSIVRDEKFQNGHHHHPNVHLPQSFQNFQLQQLPASRQLPRCSSLSNPDGVDVPEIVLLLLALLCK